MSPVTFSLIMIPLVCIAALSVYRLVKTRSSESEQAGTSASLDPNLDIDGLINKRFQQLQTEHQKVMAIEPEKPQFKTQAKAMVGKWEAWLDDFEKVLGPFRTADGELREDLRGYSDYKARAGQLRLDLIKRMEF